MLQAFRNALKIPDLRKKIVYTILLLVVYRIGAHITIPGLDNRELLRFFEDLKKATPLIGLVDMFSGGAFEQMTIFALGIQPYISASIILQLLMVVVPYLEKLSKEGEAGRKKITQYTRYGTVVLSAIQALGISFGLENPRSLGVSANLPIVLSPGLGFKLMTVVTLTAGTTFVMWLGEQITERGIGQGISLLIFAGIVVNIPGGIFNVLRGVFQTNTVNLIELLLLIVVIVAVIMGTIYITLAARKIPVQYAKRVVGRKMYGGQMTYIPLRVNQAGVIPIIFAITLLSFPTTLAAFVPNRFVQAMVNFVNSTPIYQLGYAVLIIFFTYFYTAVTTNPVQMAEDMRKYGGFIPGIRPGKNTAEYIERTLDRITLPGAFFLAAIAILPMILQRWLGVPIQFGGTPLLIVVGVALDTMNQVESHLLMRHYEGFLKKGRLRGRGGR